MSIPRSIDVLNEQLADIEKKLHATSEFFSVLRMNKLTVKDLTSIIDVKKYDEITKDFEPIQYYISFEKRREALYVLEEINDIENETYENYLLDEKESIADGELMDGELFTEDEFLNYKKERIEALQMELAYIIGRIISGDNVSIFKEDLDYARGWEFQTPIRHFDMKQVALGHLGSKLLGGMDDEKYNELIFKMIAGDASVDDLNALRNIPDGYGWPTLGLNQRVWAEIDINTPDDILFEAFKNWLKEARALPVFSNDKILHDQFSEGVVKSNHIKKWYSLRVLAYLDLKIFSTVIGVNLTMKQYADIVFCDEFNIDTTEKVRKTLIPLVKEIMGTGYLNNLLKKIIAEN